MSRQAVWRSALSSDAAILVTPALAVAWLGLILSLLVVDQLRQMPLPPATPEQLWVARPAMTMLWRTVYPRLLARLEAGQPRPPELGAVWATRAGQICGLVDAWRTGVDVMSQFYTYRSRVLFRDDDERLYVRQWSRCIMDPYVVLHGGSLATGACAAHAGQQACRAASSP